MEYTLSARFFYLVFIVHFLFTPVVFSHESVFMRFLFPNAGQKEDKREQGRRYPAYGPRQPYTRGSVKVEQYVREYYPQEQIGKGGNHKNPHVFGAPQNAVRNYFDCHHEIEGADDAQKFPSRLQSRGAFVFVHKQFEEKFGEEEISREKNHHDGVAHRNARPERFCHSFRLARAHVLRGERGYARPHRIEAHHGEST